MDFLCNIDLNKNQIQNPVIHPVGTAPSSPAEGQIYFDSTTGDKKLYLYNGSAWVALATGTDSYISNVQLQNSTDLVFTAVGSAFSGTIDLSGIDTGITSITLASDGNATSGNTITTNGTLTLSFDGASSQYVNGAGDLVTFPTIPSVGNGTLTVQGTGALGGTGTFTANQSGNTTISVTHDAFGTAGTYAYPTSITTNDTGHITAITAGSAPATPNNSTITLTGGNGLANNGGSFTLNQSSNETITFNVGGGAGITANANDVAVNVDDVTIEIVSDQVTAKTAAVVNNGTALATGDQIYDFVTSQIATIPSGLSFEGNWNANTDTPSLAGTTPDNGTFYIVSVAGSTNLSGITDWEVGDWAVYVSDGAGTDAWQKIDNTSTLSGNGTAAQVAIWSGTSSLVGDSGFTYNTTTNNLEVTGTITSSGGNSGEWNTAYDNMITGAAVSGTTTKTLTLTQQDGGTVTANWTDNDSGGTVTSIATTAPITGGTITNTGTIGISNATASNVGAARVTAGTGISVAVSSGNFTVTNTENNSDNTYATTISDTATITHGLGTKDVIIQLYDTVTDATVYACVARTDSSGNSSTSQAKITFSQTPTNDVRVLVQKIG